LEHLGGFAVRTNAKAVLDFEFEQIREFIQDSGDLNVFHFIAPSSAAVVISLATIV
jgi:hypothetical protein